MSQDPRAATMAGTALPMMVYAYAILFHVALPAILFFLHQGGMPEGLPPMVPQHLASPMVLIFYGLAVTMVVGAFVVPRQLVRRKGGGSPGQSPTALNPAPPVPQNRVLAAYLVRIGFLEICTVLGFALGHLEGEPGLALPFAAVGLLVSLASRPTPDFLTRLAAGA